MNPIVKFFHELIHPHCQHCDRLRIEELEQRELDREIAVVINVCQSCENLKMQLAVANQRVDNLINKLTEKFEELPLTGKQQEPPRIIQTGRHIPFNVTRQRLETESKLKAQELRQEADAKARSARPDSKLESKVEEIKELETELGISDAASQS